MIECVGHLSQLDGVVFFNAMLFEHNRMGEALWLRDNRLGHNSLRKKII